MNADRNAQHHALDAAAVLLQDDRPFLLRLINGPGTQRTRVCGRCAVA